MPSKKRTPSRPKASNGPSGPAWQVILEDIRSQNRVTMEEVRKARQAIEARIDGFEKAVTARFDTLEAAFRADSQDLCHLETRVERIETKVDTLVPLDARVTALERRRA